MYVPTELVSMVLYGRLTPREALIAVHLALIPIEGLKHFKPFVDWLRVAATAEGMSVTKRALPPTSPLMDSTLQARLVRTVQQDLPNWGTGTRVRNGTTPPSENESRL
jgi:hypothetical protein